MGYLEDLQVQIANRDFSKFWLLWEEYCTSDVIDYDEFSGILKAVKNSDFARQFGQYVETALPLMELLKNPEEKYSILKLIVDLQTTNSANLAELSVQALKDKYSNDPQFNERLRLVGLRSREAFQGAISNFDLLAHMKKGHFLFHTGGWGAGQIIDVSSVREQVGVEFENVSGRKDFTFLNAFKTLTPLANESFLARRFAEPDALEQEARDNPVGIIKLLLKDLGPKTAGEIKDELCELVIPEKDWTKWWQGARSKVKKDTMIDTPEALKETFKLHKAEVTHEMRLHKAMGKNKGIDELIQTSYSFARDNPAMLKKDDVKNSIKEKLLNALKQQEVSKGQELQLRIFLETNFDHQIDGQAVHKLIEELDNVQQVIDDIEIVAIKKRLLSLIREHRSDWSTIFLDLLFTPIPSNLRDYLIKELNQKEMRKPLEKKLADLVAHPLKAPEFFVWYFQKAVDADQDNLPYGDKEGQTHLFESFLILFNSLDSKPEYKDLMKKMYNMISGKRYALVRQMIEGTSLDYIKEFLLLVAKCHGFSDHDQKILRSLAEVVHPSLNPNKHKKEQEVLNSNTIWTTAEGFQRTKDRMEQISSVETIENAKEIEAARALGDLRENSEYKFALEKRSRLQGELKHLSEQLSRARVITHEDIDDDEVSVGHVVTLEDPQGKKAQYTLLGPWDADVEKGILSSQSKLAEAMIGKKKGETFNFRDEPYTVLDFKRFI